jgi:hypothetical protein
LRANEWKLDHSGNDRTRVAKAKRHGAEREAMQEINRAVNGVEQPKHLMAGRIAAFLLAQETNLRRLVM